MFYRPLPSPRHQAKVTVALSVHFLQTCRAHGTFGRRHRATEPLGRARRPRPLEGSGLEWPTAVCILSGKGWHFRTLVWPKPLPSHKDSTVGERGNLWCFLHPRRSSPGSLTRSVTVMALAGCSLQGEGEWLGLASLSLLACRGQRLILVYILSSTPERTLQDA